MSAIKMKRVLTTPALIAFGLAYMVPLGIFTTYGEVTVASNGHLPIAYVITLAMIFFTALSYCRMANKLPIAGSAYSYVQHTFGGRIGFLVGWAQILDYLFLPILNYLVLGIYLNEAFPSIPAYVFVLGSLCSVSFLNYLGIKLINSVNFTLIIVQMFFIGLFIFLTLTNVSLTPEAMIKPLAVNAGDFSGLMSGAAILCLAFLGFDAIATLAEESNDAQKSLPRAIIWTVLIAGSIFLVVSYSAHLAYPNWTDFVSNKDTASLDVMRKVDSISNLKEILGKYGNDFMYNFFQSAYLTGVFASAMTAQTSVSRIFYAMGREGVLPKQIFFKIHPRFRTPYLSILFVACFSLLSLVLDLSLVVSMISFGALVAFTFVNLCVIKSYLWDIKTKTAKVLFKYGVLPAIGVLLSLWLWTSLDETAMIVGLVWLAVGFCYLVYLTKGFTKLLPSIDHHELNSIIKD
ncbi:Putrescine importer PuuP [Gilliamella apicola]|uniref:APC family permease n=1 Tax=Gilliamella apicola TaxID=1196095 RepID=UPI00042E22DD|nr:APC family permease [Gilliamella apicola]AHN26162.1 Putrescine importer [Gilliamella apicola]OTQ32866.1 Putrescine importer PuuP [Gilliamella apicola]OTQ45788.1 Putrescine importer PuuP [Gilliamella apicola]PXV93877.1 amino acid/polyamine/organocation transporter (APC superfamily) [Gilliamella apicola]PXZ00014.1 APC family permease [Gilliamella apicola]